jgi:hypothetical protein
MQRSLFISVDSLEGNNNFKLESWEKRIVAFPLFELKG